MSRTSNSKQVTDTLIHLSVFFRHRKWGAEEKSWHLILQNTPSASPESQIVLALPYSNKSNQIIHGAKDRSDGAGQFATERQRQTP